MLLLFYIYFLFIEFINFEFGNEAKFSTRVFANFDKTLINNTKIYYSCSTQPGSSGGPIINSKNYKVIGIHQGFDKIKGLNRGLFIGDAITKFKIWFKKMINHINFNNHNNPQEFNEFHEHPLFLSNQDGKICNFCLEKIKGNLSYKCNFCSIIICQKCIIVLNEVMNMVMISACHYIEKNVISIFVMNVIYLNKMNSTK